MYSDLYKYSNFIGNIYDDTYASNLVTAIYLDYRLYDSIFEATILFVVATGIIFMVRKDTEMVDKISFNIFKSDKR
jgi:multicomponent Na+:H+ antiporter subunit B